MIKSDTEFIKYPKIYRVGHEETEELFLDPTSNVIIEEKVDGACNSFWWDEKQDQLLFGSRNRVLTSNEDLKRFGYGINYIKEIIGDGSTLNKSLIYYYENMMRHSISYDRERTPPALCFDIRVKYSKLSTFPPLCYQSEPGLFLDYDAKVKEFKRLGLPVVRLIRKCHLSDLGNKNEFHKLIPPSKYYNGDSEGIILKCYNRLNSHGKQIFAKVVSEDFKELNRATFGGIKTLKSDSSKLVEELITDARIRKTIYKLVNEDNLTLDNSLMKYLPYRVIKDAIDEEFPVFMKYKVIDIKSLKSRVAKRCFNVLSFVIKENVHD